jgi:copper chaperone
MNVIQFKTNINCEACLAKVTPVLSKMEEIEKWDVDLLHSDRILTVSAAEIDEEELIHALKKVGYKAERVG